jgi:hypothetical protein
MPIPKPQIPEARAIDTLHTYNKRVHIFAHKIHRQVHVRSWSVCRLEASCPRCSHRRESPRTSHTRTPPCSHKTETTTYTRLERELGRQSWGKMWASSHESAPVLPVFGFHQAVVAVTCKVTVHTCPYYHVYATVVRLTVLSCVRDRMSRMFTARALPPFRFAI